MRSLSTRLRSFERATRPVDPETADALKRRWDSMPESSRVPGQLIGRKSAGCEATHGVFPKCNFACKPCYHSADANKVKVDGTHTLEEVDRQMSFLRQQRGHGQFAQLIGGEVSLLDPKDHGDVLQVMRTHGRMPMSFTHGDFDYEHLRAIVTDQNDQPRFPWVSFACHMDTTMVGRKGIKKPTSEAQLNEYRGRFCQMFDRLRSEYGIRSYLAHNMTVTPDNLDQVPDVIKACSDQGWRMFSFQPAAYIGNETRWAGGYHELTSDIVWDQIEAGAGTTLTYGAMQFGDTRCNRVTWGAYLDGAYTPLLDDTEPLDHVAVDDFMTAFPGNFAHRQPLETTVRIMRSLLSHPAVVPSAARLLKRFVDRNGGGLAQPWWNLQPVTFVMHQFIDAEDTAAGWAHMKAGTRATEPRILEAQERLEACAYSMGHPDTGELVPACVQHGILDPEENRLLAQLLPLPTRRATAVTAGVAG
ncbi:MAG: radical SAM domain-containing protein [Acidimicrobiales bacterium]